MGEPCTVDDGIGAPKLVLNRCDPGLFCIGVEGHVPGCSEPDSCCLPFCDLTQPACAVADWQCVAFWAADDEPPPGLEPLGLCIPPTDALRGIADFGAG